MLGLSDGPPLRARCLEVSPGPAGAAHLARLTHPAIVISGVLLRSVLLRQREGALLYGRGDILPPGPGEPGPFRARSRPLTPARLAVLEPAVLTRVAAVPAVATVLARRLALQFDRAGLHTIIVQLPTIEERLVAILPGLSERIGTVSPEGVTLPAYLSHTVLAALIGVRRPSLTTALSDLVSGGVVERLPDRRWRVAPELSGAAA